ncbi:cell wall hydrolase [Novosphingobium lentum]|uniref:cell wall hydrolase n=1 Tax=Novosphingobium lentum TaxID=145287 RepID=UPI000835E5A1|nr:cell wall hydrolase [Novosphingobium lentum]
MPLEITYRPIVLPPERRSQARPSVPAAGAILPATERPRDFTARIRRRDFTGIGRLHRKAKHIVLRQRAAGIAVLAALGMVLGPLGWGSAGIEAARAQQGGGALASVLPAIHRDDAIAAPLSALDVSAPGLVAPDIAAKAWDVHRDDDTVAQASAPAGPAARPLMATEGENRYRALQCLTAAIYYEAASEPDGGQRAVAQVVLNRVAHPAFPHSVCGVVYQGSERTGCQFSFACDGSMARRPMAQYWDRARRVAEAALAGYVYAPVGLATHYHTSAIHPYWADSLQFIGTIGAHRFYRWQGAAGRPAAFNAAYSGAEPVAGPHPRTWTPQPPEATDPIAIARAYDEARAAALHQAALQSGGGALGQPAGSFGQAPLAHGDAAPAYAPAYTPSVAQRGGDALYRAQAPAGSGAGTTSSGSSGVLPQYENSGKWIAQPAG